MNDTEFGIALRSLEFDLQRSLGNEKGLLGIVPGTGWGQGLESVFKEEGSIPYSKLKLPGSGEAVEGHQKSLRWGAIDNRPVAVLGRIHPNENVTDPDLRQGMALLIAGLRERLAGLVITNGVGTLHGPVGLKDDFFENNYFESAIRTAILDLLGWAHRGRLQEEIRVGDVAIVDDVKTSLVGPFTPLGAGDFLDFYHNGIHRDGNLYFGLVRQAVAEVQGRCPRAQARFIPGPHFEGPADKIEFRAKGDDIIGMSGIQEMLAATKYGIPFAQIALATNGAFAPHSHVENQATGRRNGEKCGDILTLLAKKWPERFCR